MGALKFFAQGERKPILIVFYPEQCFKWDLNPNHISTVLLTATNSKFCLKAPDFLSDFSENQTRKLSFL